MKQALLPFAVTKPDASTGNISYASRLDMLADIDSSIQGAPYKLRATTIVGVRRGTQAVLAGDGQVSLGQTVVKGSARKVRKMAGGRVVAGFAGGAADAFTLLERLEAKIEEHPKSLQKAAVELAKEWRTDRYLRRLEAMMIAMDAEDTLLLSGSGDVIVPDEGVVAIGSGGSFALSAARALLRHTDMSAKDIARESLTIASEVCVYTNDNIQIEELPTS